MGECHNNLSGSFTAQRRLGDFEILREIGRGGMGVVYEAVQVSLGRKVALKVLSTSLGLTPQAVQRFQREAESAAKLHHTNIIPIYATGSQDGTHFYAMELIEGPSLDHVIRDMRGAEKGEPPAETPVPADGSALTAAYQPAPRDASSNSAVWKSSSLSSGSQYFDTVARLIAEVADALDYAHRHNVVHRDIKPANLLMAPEGRLSLNDFGLARVLEQPGMTATGEILGTPAYMSPEQVAAGRTPLDHRTDIYSLGATLYELLTLRPPFAGERRDQVLAQIIHKDPRSPRSVSKKVPVDLETICLKAMEKDPDRRYQSAGAMAEDLRRFANRFAISARRVGPVGKTTKWVRRHPGMAAGIACAILAMVVAAILGLKVHQAEHQRLAEFEQAQQELASVKRQNALENAMLAATGGNLEKAERAIGEAELNGATSAQVKMLRGQVAYFRGDPKLARDELEQAAKLNPDSTASHALLALSHLSLYDWPRYVESIAQMERTTPHSPEDYIFKGYALIFYQRRRALETLDQVVRQSSSPLARAVRAEVRTSLAEDDSDIHQIELALTDVKLAKEQLEDNPYVSSVSLMTHLVAAKLYSEADMQAERQSEMNDAHGDAKLLATQTARSTVGAGALRIYYEQTGQDEAAFEIVRNEAQRSTAPGNAIFYALALCRIGQFAEALRVVDGREWREIDGDRLRIYILCELHPNELSIARAALEELPQRYVSEDSWHNYRRALLLLGAKHEALVATQAGLARYGPVPADDPWKPISDYYLGELTDSQILNLQTIRWVRFYAHYTVALHHLASGNRTIAYKQFQNAVRIRPILSFDGELARVYQMRMTQDPNWPPWIPVRK
jgi:serine/threonine protein kinase